MTRGAHTWLRKLKARRKSNARTPPLHAGVGVSMDVDDKRIKREVEEEFEEENGVLRKYGACIECGSLTWDAANLNAVGQPFECDHCMDYDPAKGKFTKRLH